MQIQSHARREIKTNRRGEKKNHAKQYHHKYEICLMEMIKKNSYPTLHIPNV